MRLLVCSGHTLQGVGSGAIGYINESKENRELSNIVVKYLKIAGHEVDYFEINEGKDYLANKNKVGKLIAEAIHRREIEEVKEASEIFYRVIAGSYSKRENAEQQLKLLNDKGIKGGFIDIYKK